MSLTLCSTPDQLYCAQNVESKYGECLPQCSGVSIESNEIMTEYKELLDFRGRTRIFLIKKTIEADRLKSLSTQYWNFKEFYNFPKNLTSDITNPRHKKGEGRFPSE